MKNDKKLPIRKIRWIYIIGMIIIVGSVSSYGLIASLFLKMDQTSALSMLWMSIPMAFVYLCAARILVKGIEKRITKLTDAISEVSAGNLDTQIDLSDSQEYRTVYEQFNMMTKELKATRKEMEGFVNEFAHEFKTPITSIHGFSQYLLENNKTISDEERKQILEMISEQSQRLLNLSTNALLLSKVESMQSVEGKEEVDLFEEIRKSVILLYRTAEEKNISFDICEDIVLPFFGNKEMLQHVFINLLSNAIKFTPCGGEITITGERKDNLAVIHIQDSGIGMDDETMAHIFDKYYQNDTVSLSKGSGIGLTIVKRIVDLLKGKITVTSVIGKGSTFTISLPAAQ